MITRISYIFCLTLCFLTVWRADAQLSGSYNVPGDYPTMAAVVLALNDWGVSGPVTINWLPDGTSVREEVVPSGGLRLGSAALNATLSASNTITVFGNGNVLRGYTGGTATTPKAILFLLGVDHLTIDSIHFQENPSNTTNANQMIWGVALLKRLESGTMDGCNNNTIRKCVFSMGRALSTVNAAAIYAGHNTINFNNLTANPLVSAEAVAPTGRAGTNSGNTFSGNHFNAIRGLLLRGYNDPGTGAMYDQDNRIVGNLIEFGTTVNVVISGIGLRWQNNIEVRENEFNNKNTPAPANNITYGIHFEETRNATFTCAQNKFEMRNPSSGSALHVIYSMLKEKSKLIVENNTLENLEFTSANGNTAHTTLVSQLGIIRDIRVRDNRFINSLNLRTAAAYEWQGSLKFFHYDKVVNVDVLPFTASNPDTSDVTFTGNIIRNISRDVTLNNSQSLQLYNMDATHAHLRGRVVITDNIVEDVNWIGGILGISFPGVLYDDGLGAPGNNGEYEVFRNVFRDLNTQRGSVYPINATGGNKVSISDNVIRNVTIAQGNVAAISFGKTMDFFSAWGHPIDFPHPASLTFCHNNIITGINSTDGNITGIVSYGGKGYIYNNVLSGFETNKRAIGIDGSYYQHVNREYANRWDHPKNNIYYNTIHFGNNGLITGMEAIGIYTHLRNDSTDIRNNIIHLNVASTNFSKVAAIAAGYLIQRPAMSNILDTLSSPGNTPHDGLHLNNNVYYVPEGPYNFYYVEAHEQASAVAGSFMRNGFGPGGLTENQDRHIYNDPSFNSQCSKYRLFIGPQREQHTFQENNLVAGSLPGTSLPGGSSYAKDLAAATLPISVTTDYSGAARSATPDAGALQFQGTRPQNVPPIIALTEVMPSVTYCTDGGLVKVNISGANGVNTTTGTAPRLYYKRAADQNVFGNYPAQNNAAFDGWKYVEATGTAPAFTFSIDYSRLFGGNIQVGDSIIYFVVAQDNATVPNVGVNTANFSNGCSLPNVNIEPSAGAASHIAYSYKILAIPTLNAVAGQTQYCMNGQAHLKLQNLPAGTFVHWQERRGGAPFQDINGANDIAYITGLLYSDADYRAVLRCNGVDIAVSNVLTITISNIPAPSVSNGSRCGPGVVELNATASAGDSVLWYEAATGGTPVHIGRRFVTPALYAPTDYYATAYSSLVSGVHVGPGGVADGLNSSVAMQGLKFDALNTFRLDTISLVPKNGSAGDLYIKLLDAAGNVLQTKTIAVMSMTINVLNRIPLGFVIPRGNDYQLVVDGPGGNIPIFQRSNVTFPVEVQGVLTVKEGVGTRNVWNYLKDWVISIGCESAVRVPVRATVNPSPVISLSVGDTTICSGASFTVRVTSGNTGYTYEWMPGNITGNSLLVSPTATTKYYLRAEDNSGGVFNGCANSDSLEVTVLPAPVSFFNAGNENDFCYGTDSVMLDAFGLASAYQWLRNDQVVGGATSARYIARDSGSYRLVMTEGVCSDTSGSHLLNVYPLPIPEIVRNGAELTTSRSYKTYQWYWNGQAVPGATSSTYNVITEGEYAVAVTDHNDCEGMSSKVPGTISVGQYGAQAGITLYPNPVSDVIYIQAPVLVDVSLFSIDGRLVKSKENAGSLSVSELSSGVYTLHVFSKNGKLIKVERITKQDQY